MHYTLKYKNTGCSLQKKKKKKSELLYIRQELEFMCLYFIQREVNMTMVQVYDLFLLYDVGFRQATNHCLHRLVSSCIFHLQSCFPL